MSLSVEVFTVTFHQALVTIFFSILIFHLADYILSRVVIPFSYILILIGKGGQSIHHMKYHLYLVSNFLSIHILSYGYTLI